MNVGVLVIEVSCATLGKSSPAVPVPNEFVLQVVEVGELGTFGQLPGDLARRGPHQVVVEHLATVGVVVAQEVLVQPLVMSGEGEPYLVTDDGSGQPHAGVENLQDVGSWYQVGICRQRHGRN